MSLTATRHPPLNETVLTETGISEANILVKGLSIRTQPDGKKQFLFKTEAMKRFLH